jgi:hypothetical protein
VRLREPLPRRTLRDERLLFILETATVAIQMLARYRVKLWKGLFVGTVATLSVVACTKTNAALLDPSIHLVRTCPDAVELFTSPEKVPSKYQEVALLNSSGNTTWTSEAGMMKSQRQKAADVGANGIILGGIDEPGAMAKVLGGFLGTGSSRKGKALAIYIPADSTRVNRVCSGARG